jgi:GMP synthase-like glutamine amidotransferase
MFFARSLKRPGIVIMRTCRSKTHYSSTLGGRIGGKGAFEYALASINVNESKVWNHQPRSAH